MPDAAKIPAFLIHYIAECDREGINPLLVGDLARLGRTDDVFGRRIND